MWSFLFFLFPTLFYSATYFFSINSASFKIWLFLDHLIFFPVRLIKFTLFPPDRLSSFVNILWKCHNAFTNWQPGQLTWTHSLQPQKIWLHLKENTTWLSYIETIKVPTTVRYPHLTIYPITSYLVGIFHMCWKLCAHNLWQFSTPLPWEIISLVCLHNWYSFSQYLLITTPVNMLRIKDNCKQNETSTLILQL